MAQTTTAISHPKHNIHKFHDIKPKMGCDNWIPWKQELLDTARDGGLYANILDKDTLPTATNPNDITVGSIPCIGTISLTQLINEWTNCNNTTYNQVLLGISLELQTAIDDTDVVRAAWKILIKKFESTDHSKISIVRTRYDNYHMIKGQSVITYLTTMKEYRNQLEKMGETITSSTHAATLLCNLPELWRPISQTIQMITCDPDHRGTAWSPWGWPKPTWNVHTGGDCIHCPVKAEQATFHQSTATAEYSSQGQTCSPD